MGSGASSQGGGQPVVGDRARQHLSPQHAQSADPDEESEQSPPNSPDFEGQNPRSVSRTSKKPVWSRNFENSDEENESPQPSPPCGAKSSWAVTLSDSQRDNLALAFMTLATGEPSIECSVAQRYLQEIGITHVDELLNEVKADPERTELLTLVEWISVFETVGTEEPDMLDALIASCTQAVAMEQHRREAVRVFYELDPDKTESISFEGSKEKLLSMGAPDVFIQMYATMMDMYMDENELSIDDGIKVDQWLDVLASVAYNEGALNWLELKIG